jgi:hypothetical protein
MRLDPAEHGADERRSSIDEPPAARCELDEV